jgi:hypothetical protein
MNVTIWLTIYCLYCTAEKIILPKIAEYSLGHDHRAFTEHHSELRDSLSEKIIIMDNHEKFKKMMKLMDNKNSQFSKLELAKEVMETDEIKSAKMENGGLYNDWLSDDW